MTRTSRAFSHFRMWSGHHRPKRSTHVHFWFTRTVPAHIQNPALEHTKPNALQPHPQTAHPKRYTKLKYSDTKTIPLASSVDFETNSCVSIINYFRLCGSILERRDDVFAPTNMID